MKKEYGTEHAMMTDIVKHFTKHEILTADKFSEIVAKHINRALKKRIKKVKK